MIRVSHICVNYGAPLFQEFFLALDKYNIDQNVFYPRNRNHQTVAKETPFEVFSPLMLNLLTRISFRRKRRIMQQQYDSCFGSKMPDLMHAHTLFSDGSLANHYYRKYRIPYIVAFRSTDIEYFLKYKPWLKKYGRQIAENAAYIVFISPSLKRKFQKIYGTGYESKSVVIPNGIHASYLSTEKYQKKELHSPLELLYVGSFLKRKNVPSLIRLAERCDSRLTIVGGGGNQEKRVLQMIRKSGMVYYLGPIDDQSRMVDIYGQSDILVMTSRGETFGLVYIEAMSQGLPVLYSKNTGIDGFFKQGEIGFGVAPGSIPEMKTGLDKIVSNYYKISQNCFIRAKELNWDQIAETYFDLYGRIIN